MKEKESRKVDKSQVKETVLLTLIQEAVNEAFNRMRGRIYNLIEVIFEDPKRAESMKALVRDITGDAWNEIPMIVFKVIKSSQSKEDESENK